MPSTNHLVCNLFMIVFAWFSSVCLNKLDLATRTENFRYFECLFHSFVSVMAKSHRPDKKPWRILYGTLNFERWHFDLHLWKHLKMLKDPWTPSNHNKLIWAHSKMHRHQKCHFSPAGSRWFLCLHSHWISFDMIPVCIEGRKYSFESNEEWNWKWTSGYDYGPKSNIISKKKKPMWWQIVDGKSGKQHRKRGSLIQKVTLRMFVVYLLNEQTKCLLDESES